MARRPATPTSPQSPTALNISRTDATHRLEERITAGKKLQERANGLRSSADIESYKNDSMKWHDYNKELLQQIFTKTIIYREYSSNTIHVLAGDDRHIFQNLLQTTARRISKLESILERIELYPEPISGTIESSGSLDLRDTSKVFIVHGHDDGVRETVARFIQNIGFDPVILHERPNKGRTIITKFREEAAGVGFAVVLMTPDDEGGPNGASHMNPRARQNVVFELGFFIGALGAERVAALVKGNIERPSDFDGVVYISLDDGAWKAQLTRELKEAGYSIDWNKVMA